MFSNILMYVCLAGIAVSVPVCIALWLNQLDVHPLARLLASFRRLPWPGRIVVVLFAAQMILFGSVKNPTNNLLGIVRPFQDQSFVSGFTEDEISVGYVLWRIGTNESWAAESPVGALEVSEWRKRGAADDWIGIARSDIPFAEEGDRAFMTSSGDIAVGDTLFSSIGTQMSIVPADNCFMLPEGFSDCLSWRMSTAWESFACAWVNALFGRLTNTPVSVAAELSRDGDVSFKYDLSRVGDCAANCTASVSRCGRTVFAGLSTNVTSVSFYRLRPGDLTCLDRDGDGLSSWDEINVYHTDPGLADSDGDGISDGDEVSGGTDPNVRSVPNGEILDRVVGSATNEQYQVEVETAAKSLSAIKLWDGFAAEWDFSETNLVYERTLDVNPMNGWRHFFLSSLPDAAGDWLLRGLTLEWEDGSGSTGTASLSQVGDSLYLPLTNGASSVTIRLRANETSIMSATPVYLLSYAPVVDFSGCTSVYDPTNGTELALVAIRDAANPIRVTFDRSARPSSAPLYEAEANLPGLDEIETISGGKLRFVGNSSGGTLEILKTGECYLPQTWPSSGAPSSGLLRSGSRGRKFIALDPSVFFDTSRIYSTLGLVYDSTAEVYAVTNRYPVDSRCLWRNWFMSADGGVSFESDPVVTSGADDLECVSTSCTETDEAATGYVSVFGQLVWTGTALRQILGLDDGLVVSDAELLTELGECESCEDDCADGQCDSADGAELGSVKFRVSLGSPRLGQHSGFVYFRSDAPVLVSPACFASQARSDAQVAVVTNGASVTYSSLDDRGRDVTVEPMQNGTRVVARTHATGTLEYTWELVNENGNAAQIRIRQISRIGNVMRDETYAFGEGVWSSTDHISGIVESLSRSDGLNDPQDGRLVETRTVSSATGGLVSSTVVESSRIGIGVNAVLRQTYWCETSVRRSIWRRAEYWDDAAHSARHGNVRLLYGNSLSWSYHDYDENGFETLLVEQRNGSPRPQAFPTVAGSDLSGAGELTDAYVTVRSYEPFGGDDGEIEDAGKPRCETRYVVRGGAAVLIGRTWHRYTHVMHGGLPAVKHETWRAAGPASARGDASNAYSWVTTFSETAQGVPLVLRGSVAASQDENGALCSHDFTVSGGTVVDEAHTSFGGVALPLYSRTVRDTAFGNVLSEAKCLEDGDVIVDETVSTYDEKNRLRSKTFLDGTSLTNAYSCCRLLWSEDRNGRRSLRSAVTGQDRLYYAEEDVWLRDISTNGLHRVTQHFMDGLGRETNTVIYVAETSGEATNKTASAGRVVSQTTTAYPYGSSDYMVSVDERGKRTVVEMSEYEDRTRTLERVYDGVSQVCAMETETSRIRGGPIVAVRRWDGKWTREFAKEDYGADGCAVRYEISESSDCGAVTNRIVHSDFLGRTVLVETPLGNTATTYIGSSGRVGATVFSADGISRTTTASYNAFGERIGGVCDGVTTTRDSEYCVDGTGVWWRVERNVVFGSVTNSVSETRTRLTGLGEDGLVSHVVSLSSSGIVDDVREFAGAEPGVRVTVISNSVYGVSSRTTLGGLSTETSGANGTRFFSYDALGRNVLVSRGDAQVVSAYEYGASGDLVAEHTYTNADSFATERYGYDAFGRRVLSVDALGGAVTTRYDAVGNVIERYGATQPVRFAYDTAGRRTSLSTTRDGIIWDVTTWSYDPYTGKCLVKRYADDSQATYSYAGDGAVLQEVNPSGSWSSSAYDASRRLVGVTSSDGKGDAVFGYDEFGRMSSASNAVAAYAYTRNADGVATGETATVGTNVFAYARTVDEFGRVCGRGIPGARWQTISYDGRGRVASLSNDVASIVYSYSEDGQDEGYVTTLPSGAVVRRQVVRDAFRRNIVVAVTNFVNGIAVEGFDYSRDAAGRIVGCNESVFAHDALGRTTAAEICDGGSPAASFGYSYDDAGNFVSLAHGTNVVSCAANALNQCVSFGGETVVTDSDGCIAEFNGLSFGYDSALRLDSVSTTNGQLAAFAHDAFGRRVVRTSGELTSFFFYDGWNLVRELRMAGGENVGVDEYFWGRDVSSSLDGAGGVGGLVCLVRDGAAYVPLYDANGNITAYVDSSGSLVARYTYDCFGNVISSSGEQAGDFRFGFSTKYQDETTGLLLYEYRCYSPALGRWMTRDPIGEDGGINLYAFCENDPLDNCDYLGLSMYPLDMLPNPRTCWFAFSVLYFRSMEHWNFAATLLEESVLGLDHPYPVIFREGGKIGNAVIAEIRESAEYKKDLRRLIKSLPAGMSSVNESASIEFLTGDLFAAAHQVEISYDGYVCRPIRGADRVALNVTVSDTYDFEWWGLSHFSLNEPFSSSAVVAGVDVACLSQYLGVIKPFKWEAHFKESGRWKR